MIEKLISGQAEVLAVWEDLKRRAPGGNNNPHGIVGKAGKAQTPSFVNVDNIHVDNDARPSGNTKSGGLRKLQKAAREGNVKAKVQLAEVLDGKSGTVPDLPPAVLYALAAPSTSDEVRDIPADATAA